MKVERCAALDPKYSGQFGHSKLGLSGC